MNIGFWNRLAIVAASLTLLIAPVLWLGSIRNDHFKSVQMMHELCLKYGSDGDASTAPNYARCQNEMEAGYSRSPGWDAYKEVLGATAIAVAVLYALVWCAVWVAKWVWRGRQTAS